MSKEAKDFGKLIFFFIEKSNVQGSVGRSFFVERVPFRRSQFLYAKGYVV